MREILFRGKRTGNGEWVYGGSLLKFIDDCTTILFMPSYGEKCIATHDETGNIIALENCRFYMIDPSTIGQYTGLTDKNGVKIFEGDIVKVHDHLIPRTKPYHEFVGSIEFSDASFTIYDGSLTHYRWLDYELEAIGNIHDNPELIER